MANGEDVKVGAETVPVVSKFTLAYERLMNFPKYVKENYYDGVNKYKTLGLALGLGVISYYIRKFYVNCRNKGGPDRSFVRGFVSEYWLPIEETNIMYGLPPPDSSSGDNPDLKKPITWHYSEFDDFNLEFLDIETQVASEDKEDSLVPAEIILCMKAIRVLGQFEHSALMEIWKTVEVLNLKKDDILFKKGDLDDQIYILAEGQMEICLSEENRKKIVLKRVRPGGQLFSVLSFVDVITGNPGTIKTIEAKALEDSRVIKISSEALKQQWLANEEQLTLSIRRLIRRIYQVVFVALHKVLGLSTELCKYQGSRDPIPPEIIQQRALTEEDKKGTIDGIMNFFNLSSDEEREIFLSMKILLLGPNTKLLTAGSRTSTFVYVYKGEIEVSQIVQYDEREEKEHDQVMFYVTAGQGIGGLSYLADDVNIFNARIPEKAIIGVLSEELLEIKYPTCLLPIADSVIQKLSTFTRQMDFGIEWTHVDSSSLPIYKVGDEADCTYLVLSGRLRSVLNDNGNQVIMGEYGRNDWVGLVETLTKKKRTKTVLPVRDTELAKIPEGVLHMIKLKFPIVTIRLLDFLGNRVAKTYKQGHVSANSVEERNKIGKSVQASMESSSKGCSTVCLLPTTPSVPVLPFAYELLMCYEHQGSGTIVTLENAVKELGSQAVNKGNDHVLASWLANKEEMHGLVIYVAETKICNWSLQCCRAADTILILSSTNGAHEVTDVENMARLHAPRAKKELVLLHDFDFNESNVDYSVLTPSFPKKRSVVPANEKTNDESEKEAKSVTPSTDSIRSIRSQFALKWKLPKRDDVKKPTFKLPRNSRKWLELRKWLSFHHHVKLFPFHYELHEKSLEKIETEYILMKWSYNPYSDFARVTRWISGNATGLVLGGGGAKGAAHIGMLKSIIEHKIPIDLVCGVSIGSFVGGLYAAFQDLRGVEYHAMAWFEYMTKWWKMSMDLTIPIVSLLRGEAFNQSIRNIFQDIQIEDLWIPYFCVSTDVTGMGPRIHRCGHLWRYMRASMTLAGYFPPICDPVDGHYLMDGGYTNLVPANIMRDYGAKFIIAIDVSSENDSGTTNYGDHLSGFRVIMHKVLPFLKELRIPNLFKLQSQLSFIQSAIYLDIVKRMDIASVYIRPPIDEWTGGDFGEFHEIKYAGYRFGCEVFARVEPEDTLCGQWANINPRASLIHDPDLIALFSKRRKTTLDSQYGEDESRRNSTGSNKSENTQIEEDISSSEPGPSAVRSSKSSSVRSSTKAPPGSGLYEKVKEMYRDDIVK